MSVMAIGRRDPFFAKVVAGLAERGIPVRHFLFLHKPAMRRWPELADVELLDVREHLYPEQMEAKNAKTAPLPSEAVRDLRECELHFLSISDRFMFDPASVRRRRELFRLYAQFWYDYLQRNRIRVLFFEALPHSQMNLVLYFLGLHLGLKVFYVERSLIEDRVLLLSDFRDPDPVPSDFLAGASSSEVEALIDPEILGSLERESAWIRNAQGNVARGLDRYQSTSWQFVRELAGVWRDILSGRLYKDTNSQRHLRRFSLDRPFGKLDYLRAETQVRFQQRRLARYYRKHCVTADLSRDFVAFYLNFEPERTTQPMGGVFSNQLTALEMLAKSAPQGWRIYVKEHPRQFDNRVLSRHYRDEGFYDAIRRLENVQLIDPATPTPELLAQCRAVASVSGSIGWQALLAGKPAFAFGHPWYAGCRGVHRPGSLEECRKALEEAAASNPDAVRLDLLRFVAHRQEHFILGSNAQHFADKSARSNDELRESLCDGIAARLAPHTD